MAYRTGERLRARREPGTGGKGMEGGVEELLTVVKSRYAPLSLYFVATHYLG